MKNYIFCFFVLLAFCMISYAQGGKKLVIQMDKEMFIEKVVDYKHAEKWEYKGTRPAIIDFYATWCGPCKQMAPVMEELAKEYAGKIDVYKIDVDREKELASLFGIQSIPTFLFIPMEGDPQLFSGAAEKSSFQQMIDSFLLKTAEK